jgi:hypothetical protein
MLLIMLIEREGNNMSSYIVIDRKRINISDKTAENIKNSLESESVPKLLNLILRSKILWRLLLIQK